MKKASITTLIFLIFVNVYGQTAKTFKSDTIYYQLNINGTPLNDRMITVDTGRPHVFVKINCPCLNNGISPNFRSNINKKIKITSEQYQRLNPVKLTDLIKLVKANDNEGFNKKFTLYFIENLKGTHYLNRAFFLGSEIHVVE